MNIAFIGMGIMGKPMALNLHKAGHTVFVCGRRPESMVPLTDAGCTAAASPAEAASRADITIVMVSDTPDVEQVIFGEGGVIHGAKAGSVVVDMSTISPTATKAFAQRLQAQGVEMLDAPVSGGDVGAINATLSIMVGGKPEVFERVKPAFEAMGKNIVLVGSNGAGQVAKACNQIITGVGVCAVAEAVNFAHKTGVDAKSMREVLLGGFAASKILELHGQRMIERNFVPGFKAWMHQKDLRIVMDAAHNQHLSLPTAAAALQLYNGMVGSGRGEEDTTAMLKLFEQMSGENA